MKVFSYKGADALKMIQRGLSSKPISHFELEPTPDGPKASVFAFHENPPSQWIESTMFPNAWGIIQQRVGWVLTEVDVTDIEDSVMVGDYGYIHAPYASMYGLLSEAVDDRFNSEGSQKAFDKYVSTSIRLSEFLSDDTCFELPELYITCEVEADRFQISDSQPRLESGFFQNVVDVVDPHIGGAISSELISLRGISGLGSYSAMFEQAIETLSGKGFLNDMRVFW